MSQRQAGRWLAIVRLVSHDGPTDTLEHCSELGLHLQSDMRGRRRHLGQMAQLDPPQHSLVGQPAIARSEPAKRRNRRVGRIDLSQRLDALLSPANPGHAFTGDCRELANGGVSNRPISVVAVARNPPHVGKVTRMSFGLVLIGSSTWLPRWRRLSRERRKPWPSDLGFRGSG